MALLFIAAEARELKSLAARLTGLRPLKWPIDYAEEGILDDRRILLAANGAGPTLAAQALEIGIRAISAADLQSSVLEAVVSVGLCGALQPDLREGQVIVAKNVLRRLASAASSEPGSEPGPEDLFPACAVESQQPFTLGDIISQDRIACTADEKAGLGRRHNAVAIEMEAFGVAARAKRAGLPFYCIKVVSDRADESFGIDFNQLRRSDGRVSRGKIMARVVAKPYLIPELFRLKRSADRAARALGDFLVGCRFSSQSVGVGVAKDG